MKIRVGFPCDRWLSSNCFRIGIIAAGQAATNGIAVELGRITLGCPRVAVGQLKIVFVIYPRVGMLHDGYG